jgi:hypothetical protein
MRRFQKATLKVITVMLTISNPSSTLTASSATSTPIG